MHIPCLSALSKLFTVFVRCRGNKKSVRTKERDSGTSRNHNACADIVGWQRREMVKGTIPHRVEYRQAAHLRFQATEPVGAYIPESMSGADPGGGEIVP